MGVEEFCSGIHLSRYYPPPKIQVQIKLDGKYLPVQIFRDAVTTVVLQ
jgi:hypothetical protein